MGAHQDEPAFHQLVADLKSHAAQQEASDPSAQLLSKAAAAMVSLQQQVEDLQENGINLMKPSAWATRENKYKKDLQELRRVISQHEEDAARMKEELQAASTGTLGEKLRADLKALQKEVAEHKAARTELKGALQELNSHTQTLLGLSPVLGPVWKDICAGKRITHNPLAIPLKRVSNHSVEVVQQVSDSSITATASDGGSTSGHNVSSGGDVNTLQKNSSISIEHLSVSAAKAKIQAQLLAAGAHSMPHPSSGIGSPHALRPVLTSASTLDGRSSAGGGRNTPHGIGSRATSRRHSVRGTPHISDAAENPFSTMDAPSAHSMPAHLQSTVAATAADDDKHPAPAAATHPADGIQDDSQLVDLDVLLAHRGSAPTAAGDSMVAMAPVIAPTQATSTARGPQSPFSQADAAAQVVMALATKDAATHIDKTGTVEVGTSMGAAGTIDAGTRTDPPMTSDAATNAEAPGTQDVASGMPPVRVSDAGTHTEPVGMADAATHTEAAAQADAATAMPPVRVSDAGMQLEAVEVVDSATQSEAAAPVLVESSTQADEQSQESKAQLVDATVQCAAAEQRHSSTQVMVEQQSAEVQAVLLPEQQSAEVQTCPLQELQSAGVQVGSLPELKSAEIQADLLPIAVPTAHVSVQSQPELVDVAAQYEPTAPPTELIDSGIQATTLLQDAAVDAALQVAVVEAGVQASQPAIEVLHTATSVSDLLAIADADQKETDHIREAEQVAAAAAGSATLAAAQQVATHWEAAAGTAKAELETARAAEARLTEQVASLQQQLEQLQMEHADKELQLEQLQTEHADKQQQLEQLQTEHADKQLQLEQLQTEHADKQQQLEQLQTEHADKQQQLEQLQTEHADKQQQLEQLQTEHADKQQQLEQLQQEHATQQQQIEQLQQEHAGTQQQLEQLQQQHTGKLQQFEQLQQERAKTQVQIEQLQQEHADKQLLIEQLQAQVVAAQAAAPLAERGVDQAKSADLHQAQERLQSQLAAAQAELEDAKASAVHAAKELSVAQEELAHVKEQLAAAQRTEQRMQQELQAYEHTVSSLRSAVEHADMEKATQEAQNIELASRLAQLQEFATYRDSSMRRANKSFGSWLKRQPSLYHSNGHASGSHEDAEGAADEEPKEYPTY